MADSYPFVTGALLTVAEVAAGMRVSNMTVYRLIQAGDVSATFRDRHVQRDQLDAAAETLLLRFESNGNSGRDEGGREQPRGDGVTKVHGVYSPERRFGARTVRPGCVTVTSTFCGGINISGRA